ncbi:MAG TPA: hypothetical protein VHE35_26970 [Kofleriaceae bacterium]|nr:hypothetical protein [Kofleriaceae bacterium]
MSARRPRSSFAAPLVVTLAMAPACVVRTHSSAPPPQEPRQTANDHRNGPIMNPPRPPDHHPPPPSPEPGPSDTPRQTEGGGDVVQAGPSPSPAPALRSWRVSQRADDKSCYAMADVHCPPPPSTCNPPPAMKVKTCPTDASPMSSVILRELSPGECFYEYPPPPCPAGASCNPPRPSRVDCPTY